MYEYVIKFYLLMALYLKIAQTTLCGIDYILYQTSLHRIILTATPERNRISKLMSDRNRSNFPTDEFQIIIRGITCI
jgi:hypothetical protein